MTGLSSRRIYTLILILLMTFSSTGCAVMKGSSGGKAGKIEISDKRKAERVTSNVSETGENADSLNNPVQLTQTLKEVVEKQVTLICEIKGEVRRPGVYELVEGMRINDLIEKAGGLTENASIETVNRAQFLSDSDSIIIPHRDMDETKLSEIDALNKKTVSNETAGTQRISTDASSSDIALININTADQATLETLPGVGPVTAKNIISYREENGPFNDISEIKKVSRIGEKTFEKLKDHICTQ